MSPDKKRDKTFDGYVRVSRVSGRSGGSFLSPGMQRKTIERLAAANGITLGEVVEEMDVSGGKSVQQRELGRLRDKIVAGGSGGLIVWKVSRYSRNFLDGILTAEAIRQAGGRIIGEDVDTASPGSRGILAFMLDRAEEELDQRRAGWKYATDSAIERGVYVGPAPTGYVRNEEGTLSRVEGDCERIARAYAVRASGGSWNEVARALEGVAHGRRKGGQWLPGYPLFTYTSTGARALLGNPIYKGILKNGREHFFAAYAVVSQETWARANERRVEAGRRQRPGRALLAGLLKCACCGRALTAATTTRGDRSYAYYACKSGAQFCGSPARLKAELVEPWIVDRALSYLAEAPIPVGEPLDVEKQTALEQARDEAAAEISELDAARAAGELSALAYGKALDSAQAALDARQAALDDYKTTAGVKHYGDDATEWVFERLDTEGRRAFLRAVVERVRVARDAARQASAFGLGETVTGIDVEYRQNPWADLARVAVTVKEP